MAADADADPDGPTLQSSLEVADPDGPDGPAAAYAAAHPAFDDPVALFAHLDLSGRFHRDSRAGRLYHAGMVSFRENVPTDSLHVVVDGNRLAAHVDGVSPLAVEPGGPSRYSARRAVAHNLAGITTDFVWLLRGRQGDHSCVLNCEWVPGEEPGTRDSTPLLDPTASAWSVQMEARVAGHLSVPRLRTALGAALGAHAVTEDLLAVVACEDGAALDAARARLQRTVVPVTARPPLRIQLVQQASGDVLMLNINHAAADSVGALRVLQRIARAYADPPEPEPGAALEFLAGRDVPVRPASPATSALARSGARAVEFLRDKLARTGRLASDEPSAEPGYGYHHVGLSAHETAQVLDAERPGTSRNVLLAALHLAIGDWNARHDSPGRRIGVLVPANLRPPDWAGGAIGNFSVTARVSTNRRERAGATAALKAVTAQTTRNKRTRTGVALIAALERSGLLELWAKQSTVVLQPLTGNRLVDTAMLCNLGSPAETPSFGPDAGETVELWFSTPARSPTSLCIGAVTIGGRLQLTFRYPHRLFGPDAAQQFADCCLHHLRLVAAAADL